MDLKEIIIEAINTLTVNKLRTVLAVLGIIIGIGSVIALISLGQSSQKAVENQIQSLGSNLLTVTPGSISSGGVRGATGGGTTLTLEDGLSMQRAAATIIPDIVAVSPEYSARIQVTTGSTNANTQIIGVYPQYADIHKVEIFQGVFIKESDVNSLNKVAVIGPAAASSLFGDGVDPLGQNIRANGQLLKIIGITLSKGGSGFNNPDDAIYVPLSTAQKVIFGKTNLTSLAVEAKSQDVMTAASDEVGYFLLKRHNISDPGSADFSIFSQNDILNTASQVTGTFTTLLGGIAAISLFVGGIGIMNIMLVTVTERTREIGLRKALGAKRKLIITQFLVEATLLTAIGGFVGMLVGVGISFLLSKVMNLPFAVSLTSVLLAIGVSGAVGIVFGWYPARKASLLQPIEALRYE